MFKSKNKLLLSLLFFFLIMGCSNQPPAVVHPPNEPSAPKGEVIDSHGNVKSLEHMDAFLSQIKKNETSSLRVTHYTIEGDPIYNDLSYSNHKLELRYDTSKDKFSGGAERVKTYSCESLERNETDTFLKYTLTGCTGESEKIDVLNIPFDVQKQDVFEFSLNYGVDGKNEINTIDQKLVKDLQNGTMVEVSDFQLSKDYHQKIYKKMVLSNYLGKKQLSTTCSQKSENSYRLKVKINSGFREFQWSDCDNSEDGKAMTVLAKEIISVVESTDIYKNLSVKSSN
jgi:hypothetical protein